VKARTDPSGRTGHDERRAQARQAWDALAGAAIRRRLGRTVPVEAPSRWKRASLWTLVHVLGAANDLAALAADPGLDRLLRNLARYRSRGAYAPEPRAPQRFFDDNAWLGLLSMRLGGVADLARARATLRFVRTGEDPAGGVLWVEGGTSRNACSTAPAAELALALDLDSGRTEATAFAVRCVDWLDRTLATADGLYADNLEGGSVEPTIWSYNQGASMGAHRLVAASMGDPVTMERARTTALASLALFEGDRLWHEPPPFLAIWFRELLAFDEFQVTDIARDRLDGYLDRVLREARDPATRLFTAGGIGSFNRRPTIDQAAFVQLFALAAGAPPRPAGDP
jgi:hypothetical protein